MTDIPLLRNKSGTARDRDPQEPVEELEFEAAIGRNVRQLRQQQGLTVAEMAARVGISKAMMSKIENAQTSCSLSTLALLAKGFDVPVTTLFRGADVRPALKQSGRQTGGHFGRQILFGQGPAADDFAGTLPQQQTDLVLGLFDPLLQLRDGFSGRIHQLFSLAKVE